MPPTLDQDSLDGLYILSGLGIQGELERVCWGEGRPDPRFVDDNGWADGRRKPSGNLMSEPHLG